MKTSQKGKDFIKGYESLKLIAYKAVKSEKLYTIGYGHYGVAAGTIITKAQAEALFEQDIAKAEAGVNKYVKKYNFNQNQYDALVSFAFNLGAGKIGNLTAYGTRKIATISAKIPAYNKSGGVVLKGLVNRRAAEKKLFDTPCNSHVIEGVDYSLVFDATYYASRYADLRAAFGNNEAQLWNHFKEFGMKEGRQAIDTFNVITYKARYSDLQIAFGNNLPMYYRHYCVNGKNEGRQAI